jgi:hypothetical protein
MKWNKWFFIFFVYLIFYRYMNEYYYILKFKNKLLYKIFKINNNKK